MPLYHACVKASSDGAQSKTEEAGQPAGPGNCPALEVGEGRRLEEPGPIEERVRIRLGGRTAVATFKYKPVAKKVRPQEGVVPERCRVKRRRHPNPFEDLPEMPVHPPDFEPTGRLTRERYLEIPWNPTGFLWENEVKLIVWIVGVASHALAWDVTEAGKFDEKYFDPVIMPVVPHKPWQEKQRPIAPGAMPEVLKITQDRVEQGVYEGSSASYSSNTFPVPKANGKLRLVHDNQQLNKVTIRDASVPPHPDQIVDSLAGRSIYTTLDLHAAFDQRALAEESRDMTSFHSPFGLMRCTRLLMGHTNSFQILQGDMEHIYMEMKADGTVHVYCDDLEMGGPRTRYELPGGGYATIEGNPGIRKFVWEHFTDVLKVLWLAKKYGITFSAGKKMVLGRDEVTVLGHRCSYNGRSPDKSKIESILHWGPCKDASDVRKFLGTTGVLRMFIKNYSLVARPLIDLTRKFAKFVWGPIQEEAMQIIKNSIEHAPCLAPIDYQSDGEVIIGVDSSEHGVGWYLAQIQPDGKRRYCRFGSVSFTGVQGRYGQSKCELFGLYMALTRARFWLFGARHIVLEHDAKYLKGMVDKPDTVPDASLNRWIAGIKLFTFEWRHIPGRAHVVADGLSRRVPAPGEIPVSPEHNDADEFVERIHGFALRPMSAEETEPEKIEESSQEAELDLIRSLLSHENWRQAIDKLSSAERQRVLSYVGRYRYSDGTLYLKGPRRQGSQMLVVPVPGGRADLIRAMHDDLGHKGVFAVYEGLRARFWWPRMREDIQGFIKTCDRCQRRNEQRPVTERRTPEVPGIFRKWHLDTKHMPKSGGCNYILQARCALSGYPEVRAIADENAHAITKFVKECIISRYGPCVHIVTDNGAPYVKALQDLKAEWPTITHIRITPYNSPANGIVERAHRTLQESLFKLTEKREWKKHLNTVVMAERLAVRKSLGSSPFYLAHGFQPTLPMDLSEHTMFEAAMKNVDTPDDLLASRDAEREKRESELRETAAHVKRQRESATARYNAKNANRAITHKVGDLVLVRDTTRDSRQDAKPDDRYQGPYVVVQRGSNGAYKLVLLERPSATAQRVSGRRIMPYHSREDRTEEIREILESMGVEASRESSREEEETEPEDELSGGE